MKPWRPWIIGAGIGALGMLLLPLSGVLPHGATGPPGLAGWYQRLSDRQSVGLRALATFPPDLKDSARAARAAGHYERVCAACHGSPAGPAERFAEDLWPEPPPLGAGHWRSAAHQFQVVTHGIRRTAMPGWPAPAREDEVWDMVAFLQLLPGLSDQRYRAMAGEGRCTDCHGARGEGRDGIPRLDIQTPDYLAAVLRAYRDGTRQSGVMIAAARDLDDQQIDALAARFGRAVELHPGAADAARDLARTGRAERDIPACMSCHGPAARADYPRLIGQDARYLRQQLELFKSLGRDRGGTHAATMAPVATRLSSEEIAELAEWLARAAEK